MREERVQYFTETEEEFTNLLIEVGVKKNVARMLVFFANTKEATSREIEHGVDIRQPEASIAIKYMTEQGWIQSRETSTEGKGRPQKIYSLTMPVKEIIGIVEKSKKEETNSQLALVRKIRNHF